MSEGREREKRAKNWAWEILGKGNEGEASKEPQESERWQEAGTERKKGPLACYRDVKSVSKDDIKSKHLNI